MRIGAVVLARLDSRRLPDKVLRSLNGRPLIQYAFDACAATAGLDLTVLATTSRPDDDRLVEYAESQGIPCFRGATDDVAGRFLAAMEQFDMKAGLRFNGDSPLNRPQLLAEAVSIFRSGDWDFVTNVPGRSYPFGISAEVIGLSVMKAACAAMTDSAHREHVTKFFYDFPSFAHTRCMTATSEGMTGIQLAVDDAEDMERVAWILRQIREPLPQVSLPTIVELAKAYDRIARPANPSGIAEREIKP